MKSLYISDNYIEYSEISGSKENLKLKNLKRIELSRGIIVNGFILDVQEFKNSLDFLKNDIKLNNLHILLETNAIIQRRIEIPIEIKKNYDNFVNIGLKEFQEVNKDYYFSIIRKIENKRAFLDCALVEKDKIDSYINIFKSLKIKILSLESANSCIMNSLNINDKLLLEFVKKTDNPNFYLIYFCNSILNITFFENGNNVYNIRTRIFDEKDSNNEIIENLVNIFRMQRQDSFSILSFGLNEEIIDYFHNMGMLITNLDVSFNDISSYGLFNYFIKSKERLDFINVIEKNKKIRLTRNNKIILGFFIILLFGLFGFSYGLTNMANNIEIINSELFLQLESLKFDKDVIISEKYDKEKAILDLRIDNMNTVTQLLQKDRVLQSIEFLRIFNVLTKFENSITKIDYARENNVFAITGVCTDINMPSRLSKELRGLNIFYSINYKSKAYEEREVGIRYSYYIECIQKEENLSEIK